MNIAIIGYGKMGREIERLAKDKGINIISIIDSNDSNVQYREINDESLNGVDVCIDFTHPSSILENIKKAAVLGKNMVVGTTGWYSRLDEARKIVEEAGTGLIWSGNFSIGDNIFLKIIADSAK